MQQVVLPQILSDLETHFQSVDVRAAVAVTDSGVLCPLLVCLRISAKPVGSVEAHYALLEDRHGPRKAAGLKILWTTTPFRTLNGVWEELQQQKLRVEQIVIPLARGVAPATFHPSIISRFQGDLQPAVREKRSSALFSAGSPPIRDQVIRIYQDPRMVAELVRVTRFSIVDEFVGSFLEVTRPSNYDRDVLVQVEMPANISDVRIVDGLVDIVVEAEKRMSDLSVVVEVREGPSARARQRMELELQGASEGEMFRVLRASARLDSLGENEHIGLVLKHRSTGLQLDEENGSVWRFMPPEEKNPLLECVRLFGAYERLRARVESGLRGERAPQEGLQRIVTAMLSLLGFAVLDLGQEGKLREPDSKVERATLDVIAYDPAARIVLAVECTLNVPKAEDYDKLLNATTYLREMFSPQSQVRVIPLLASMQESEPVQREESGRRGIRILNAGDLRSLLRLVEAGDRPAFLRYLEWPVGGSLGSFVEAW